MNDIVSLVGKVDGYDVIFYRDTWGLWKTTVPFQSDGEYIVELYATNRWGNSSYYATILFTIDLTKLSCKMSIVDYSANLTSEEMKLIFSKEKYNITIMEDLYTVNINVIDYKCNFYTERLGDALG